jgi:hypothetical protein
VVVPTAAIILRRKRKVPACPESRDIGTKGDPRPSTLIKIGGERGPVILVAFKAIDPALRESGGGFDSHTLPPKKDTALLEGDAQAAIFYSGMTSIALMEG